MKRMATNVMKAVQVFEFGGPEVLKVVSDVKVPQILDSQVLIKVHSAGINPVDTYIRTGLYAASTPPRPYIPGQDVAGVVEDVGADVKKLKKGDRVYTIRSVTGSYAEYSVADEDLTCRLHENLSFSQGASLGTPYFTAYRALMIKGQAKPGNSVLIHGASGAVGLAACQIGSALGMKVYGTAGSSEGLELVKQNGACGVFNHKEEGYIEKIRETSGGGVDVIVEMLSNINLQNDLTLLNKHGRVIVVGCRAPIEINPRMMMGKELSIIGCALGSSEMHELKQSESFMFSGMATGWLKPVIHKEYTLEQASQAHQDIINNTGAKGKLVFKIRD